jgi:hypothetical protein
MSKKKDNILSRAWTQDEMGYLYAAREDGIPYKIIATELKRTVRACEKKYQTTVWSNTEFFDSLKDRMKNNLKQQYLKRLVKTHETQMKSQKFKTEIIADKIALAVDALPRVKKPVYKRTVRSKKHSSGGEDVGLMLSDMHIGHHHTLEETGGLSEYNVDVFKTRINNVKKATEEIVELHSQLYKIDKLHIFSLGDIVAGMNRAGNWSPVYINMPIYDQMIEGFEAFSDVIYYWLGLFDEITFYGVMGNHGRAAAIGYEKEYVNWDFLCYKFLEARFKDNPRVKFVVPKTWWILANIRNHNFLVVHGEDVKGGVLPVKGLQNYEQKMIGIIKTIPDYTLSAHFHAAAELTTNHGRLLINGSFVGPDIYALKNLQSSSKAEQKIFGIHDNRGITWSYNLDLDHDR